MDLMLYISGSDPDEGLRADLEGRKRSFLAKPFRGADLLRKTKELLLMQPAAPCSPAKTAFGYVVSAFDGQGDLPMSGPSGIRRKR